MVDLKAELLRVLQRGRAVMLTKLAGLSEYDRRRPSTPTGTNLLGLVKHLAGHADIIREQIDGRLGDDEATVDADAVFWRDRRSRVQEAADHYRVL